MAIADCMFLAEALERFVDEDHSKPSREKDVLLGFAFEDDPLVPLFRAFAAYVAGGRTHPLNPGPYLINSHLGATRPDAKVLGRCCLDAFAAMTNLHDLDGLEPVQPDEAFALPQRLETLTHKEAVTRAKGQVSKSCTPRFEFSAKRWLPMQHADRAATRFATWSLAEVVRIGLQEVSSRFSDLRSVPFEQVDPLHHLNPIGKRCRNSGRW